MLARQRGRIVNMASNAGVMPAAGSSVGAGAYMVSKTALIRLTEVLAAETSDRGISVFAISPSAVRTGLTEAIVTSPVTAARAPDFVRRWINIFAEGRDVPAERGAQLVVALASGQADALSGCFIRETDNLAELVRSVAGVDGDHLHKLRLRT
jgi:NAD(P)-dependent dehydrogenase (short-subunit alcohol dehydrogenase family)